VREGNLQKIKNLINLGVSLNVRYNDGTTPLHYAAGNNANIEILKYLISQGPDVNAKDKFGKIPLDYLHDNDEKKSTYLQNQNPNLNPISACCFGCFFVVMIIAFLIY
jgi:ankyrin repeat protein